MYSVRPVTTRGLGRLGAVRTIDQRLCKIGEEFCDDTCVKQLLAAKAANPSKFACVTLDQQHYLIDTCEALRAGSIDASTARARIDEVLVDACAKLTGNCSSIFDQWAAQNPQQAACLTDQQIATLINACTLMAVNRKSAESVRKMLDEYVAACEGMPPEPPVPPPAPPPPQEIDEQPIMSPPVEMPVYDVQEPPVYTPGPIRSQQQERSMLGTWGPIVGIVLVVGGVAYALR